MPRKLTSVVNLKNQTCDVRIDRKTKWGNPFRIGKDGTRTEVIKKYVFWFEDQDHLIKAIIRGELDGKRLGCWCNPLPCHGHYLAILANRTAFNAD